MRMVPCTFISTPGFDCVQIYRPLSSAFGLTQLYVDFVFFENFICTNSSANGILSRAHVFEAVFKFRSASNFVFLCFSLTLFLRYKRLFLHIHMPFNIHFICLYNVFIIFSITSPFHVRYCQNKQPVHCFHSALMQCV